jgi:hypothetical protein
MPTAKSMWPTADVRWGIRWALRIATVFSAWVLVLALAKHSWRFRFDELEMTAGEIVAAYYAAALVAGTCAGVQRPLTRWRTGTFLLGAAVSALVYATVGITMYGWNKVLWLAPVLGLSSGGLALVMKDEEKGQTIPNRRRLFALIGLAVVLLVVLWRMYWAR